MGAGARRDPAGALTPPSPIPIPLTGIRVGAGMDSAVAAAAGAIILGGKGTHGWQLGPRTALST